MSTRKGNGRRSRPQKHQNRTAFKNTLHCNEKTKFINSLRAEGCCARCKEIIEWKIRYKKYKPLTQPKKCIKCDQKTVKRAYFIVCQPCAEKHKVCVKCGRDEEIVVPVEPTREEILRNQALLEQELKFLPERKRRTFLRLQATGKLKSEDGAATCRGKCEDGFSDSEETLSDEEEDDSGEFTDDSETEAGEQNSYDIVGKTAKCSKHIEIHSDLGTDENKKKGVDIVEADIERLEI